MVMPMFLHVNLLHIAFNLYFQFSEGFACQAEFGGLKFLFAFALSGVYIDYFRKG